MMMRTSTTTAILLWALLCSGVHAATLARPVGSGSPDQPWGARRAVTEADRAAIAAYRAPGRKPEFETSFANAAQFGSQWKIVQDDNNPTANTRSCRRPDSVKVSASGLELETVPISGCKNPWATGFISSTKEFGYGFYEARMKIADAPGLNNSFWLVTDDHFEIDIAEAQYPGNIHYALHNWPPKGAGEHAAMGWGATYRDDLSAGFHDIGALWTENEIVYEIDGTPVAAVVTHGAVRGPAEVRFSTLLGNWAGEVPEHPEGHGMFVKSLRIFSP